MKFVYKTIPRHTEENVAIDQILEIYFMVDLDQKSIKKEHIILFNLTEQEVEEVDFRYNQRVLKIHPVTPLKANNHYQLQIVGGKNGVKDIIDRTMSETYELEFYTKDVEQIKPPRILSPTHMSTVYAPLEIQLEPVKEADHYELQLSKSNTFQNLIWPIDDEVIFQLPEIKVMPDIELEEGNYYIRARSVDKENQKSSWSNTVQIHVTEKTDIENDSDCKKKEEKNNEREVVLTTQSRLQEKENQLSVLQKIFGVKEKRERLGVHVKRTTPKNKSVHNKLDKVNQIVIEFTHEIDPSSITEDKCYLLVERN